MDNPPFHLGVIKRFLAPIRRVRPEYREKGSWLLLHNNAPTHQPMSLTDFLTKNGTLSIEHFLYSPDLSPYNSYFFGRLHLPMKGKLYADIKNIQRSTNAILIIIFTDEINVFFNSFLHRAKRCIESEGVYFE